MNSTIKLALYDATVAGAISDIELRIIDRLIRATEGSMRAFSNPQLAELTGLTIRTVTRHMTDLVRRGYLLVRRQTGLMNEWGVAEPATWGDPALPEAAATLANSDYSQTGPVPTVTIVNDDYSQTDPPPADRTPTPQTQPSRGHTYARASSSSSVCVFNPDLIFHDPQEEEAARELVTRLGLTYRQARQGVRANPGGVNIDGWLDWLARVRDPEPMRIVVSRIVRGECVPMIYSDRKPPAADKPVIVPMPSPERAAEIREQYSPAARAARRAARL